MDARNSLAKSVHALLCGVTDKEYAAKRGRNGFKPRAVHFAIVDTIVRALTPHTDNKDGK